MTFASTNRLAEQVRALTAELIRRVSVTPDDAGCQPLIAERFQRTDVTMERYRFGEVDNLFITHGDGSPHLLLLGHTDVVPSGPAERWQSPPFEFTLRDGYAFGRGTADMKSSDAAMVVALEAYLRSHADHPGRISLLLTSDEEGPAQDGVRRVVPELDARGWLPDAVLVGEPSSKDRLGDIIRVGRRGSIQACLTIRGVQGHTAYAEAKDNPAHRAGALLAALGSMSFDDGDDYFPPTKLQISNIQAGTGAENVTPGELGVWFNLRFNPSQTAHGLKLQLDQLIAAHDVGESRLSWRVSGEPFGPAQGNLLDCVTASCQHVLGTTPRPDTGGGTSDGRFFGPMGIEVVELGPLNRTIHQVDECIALDDLDRLPLVYLDIMESYLD
ncbi:MAG: succinyl-diaminopimelate desuccinylase [Pseudomonadota bacterium]